MCGADDGVNVYNRHDSVPIVTVVRFKNPQAIVRVGVSETPAEVVNECAFKSVLPEGEQKEELYPRNIKAAHVRPSLKDNTVVTGRCDTTHFSLWGRPDRFTVESLDARRVAWGTEDGFGGMVDGDVFNSFDGWAGSHWRSTGGGGVLLVE